MRWLHVSAAVCCMACFLCLCAGYFAVPAAAVEAAAVSDPRLVPTDPSSDPTENTTVAVDPTDPADSSGAVLLSTGDMDSAFAGLAYLDVTSKLGELRLYLPYGVDLEAVQIVSSRILNLSSNTVYLYSPDFPDYTFYASRFSPVQYRVSNVGSYTELSGVTVQGSGAARSEVEFYIFVFVLVIIAFVLIRRGLFSD